MNYPPRYKIPDIKFYALICLGMTLPLGKVD